MMNATTVTNTSETTVTPLGRERRLFISDLRMDDDRTLLLGECKRFDDGAVVLLLAA